MKKYIGVIRGGFLEGCAYRSNFVTGMLGNFIQTAVLYFVWKSIYSYQSVVGGMTWDVMQRYVFVAFLCNSTFSFGFQLTSELFLFKGILAKRAHGANPVFGNIFPRCAGGYSVIGVTQLGVVNIAARANIFIHSNPPLLVFSILYQKF